MFAWCLEMQFLQVKPINSIHVLQHAGIVRDYKKALRLLNKVAFACQIMDTHHISKYTVS